jgi:hypothetical protein
LSSRWQTLVAALAIVAAVGVVHHEVLFGGRIYHMDDAADGYYPSHVAIARAWREGVLPTWERNAWSGWPLAVDPYYGPFYPLTVIYGVAGAARGLGFVAALHMVLAGLGGLWLCRKRGLHPWAALLGGASLALSSWMMTRVRHVIFIELTAWIPFMLVGVEGWVSERRRRWLALTASAVGMAILSGGLPLLPFAALFVGAYAVPRLLRAERRMEALIGLGAVALVGGAIGAVQLLPTLAHLPLSPRALGTDASFAASYAWPGPAYLGTLIAPDVMGTEERGHWFGAFNHWEMSGYYAGALIVVLAPLGLVRARRRPELWVMYAVSLVAVLLAFGDALPVHKLFYKFVPLYGAMRCPTRALVIAMLAWPICAAEAAEWLISVEKRRRWAAVALVLWTILCLVAIGFMRRAPPHVALNETVVRTGLLKMTMVLWVGAAFLFARLGGLLDGRAAVAGLALVTLVDLVSLGRTTVQPREADFATGTDNFYALKWLREHDEGARWLPAAHGPFRLHNAGMTYGFESAGGYDSTPIWRYVHLLWILNHGAPYPHPTLRDDLAAGTVTQMNSPLVDLLGVRWFIGPDSPGPRWVERYAPPPGAKPLARHEPTWDARLRVYENAAAMPRAFVVYDAQVVDGEKAAATALSKLDVRHAALLETAPDPKPVGDHRELTPARLTAVERQRVVIEADTAAPGILVLTEAMYPGWTATVDDKPAPLLTADYALRGVALSAGHHVVEMRFTSVPVRRGLWISSLGLLGLLLLVLARRR